MLIILFLLGTAIGSFLNVLIDRIPAGLPLFIDRSHCDRCKHTLSWYDLIPILSWVLLGAKCRYCKAPISIQYPVIEAITGLVFVLSYYFPIYSVSFTIILFSLLIALFMTDLKYYLLPDKLMYPLLGVSAIALLVYEPSQLITHIISAVLAAVFFVMLIVISRGKGMGWGDVMYGLFLGILLGHPGTIVALYIAFLTGAFISVILLLSKKKKFGQIIPFGPFLILGTVISLYYSDYIWNIFF
ncbi:prepilin peptidase [Candidatus Roizmanbacteria bacterium CG_4_9_14_0_2_um_filter_38_17]|nr:prepilin peptidase [Candidatus Microgenomates bacterium]PJC30595.1 MAG: prepilin peptidase [Candidatus Roizmanbacteria bacterium CG_4_9_14_0_2_um_filter_38_17]